MTVLAEDGTGSSSSDASAVVSARLPVASQDTLAVIALGLATVVGGGLRASLAWGSGLWRDEAQAMAVAALPSLREMVAFLVGNESHPPVFYLLLRAWTGIVGGNERLLTLLPLIPGTLLIPLAGAVAWRHGGWRAGLVAGWLTAFAWPLVWQAGDLRPYALIAFLTLAAAAAEYEHLARGSWPAALVYFLGSVGILYLHNWSVLTLVGLGAAGVGLCMLLRGDRWGRFKRWCVLQLCVAAAYLLWIPAVLAQARDAGYPPDAGVHWAWLLAIPILMMGLSPLTAPLGLLTLLATWSGRRLAPQASPAGLYFGVVALLPCMIAIVGSRWSGLTQVQCFIPLVPLFLVAIALRLSRSSADRWRHIVGKAASVLMIGLVAFALSSAWVRKSNAREMSEVVREGAARADWVVVHPASILPVVRHYVGSSREMRAFPAARADSPIGWDNWYARLEDRRAIALLLGELSAPILPERRIWLLSQVRRETQADSTAPPGSRQRFEHAMQASLELLRAGLREQGFRLERQWLPTEPHTRELIMVEVYGPDEAAR